MLLDAQGRPETYQACGAVTSAFPRATVFFQTELAANASDGAIARAILESVAYEYAWYLRILRELAPELALVEARDQLRDEHGLETDYLRVRAYPFGREVHAFQKRRRACHGVV